jgi:hypothetical protein
MVPKVYEWLRAADLKPDDAMVTSRTKAVQDLEKKIRESKTYGLTLGIVTAAVGGCERLGEQSSTYTTLLECVRTQSPAFPSAIAENGLHLRMIGCLALGELLTSNEEDESDSDELIVGSLLVSGLGLKPKEAGRHLDGVFEELGTLARTNLQKQAVAARERQELTWKGFDALQSATGDPANFNQQLLPALKELFQELEKQRQSDREELEVIWWLYNGHSEQLEKQLKAMPAFLAATAIGCELADRITPPATAGLGEMVSQATVRDRTPTQIKAKPVAKIVTELGETGRKLLLPSAEHVRKFARGTGTLLPLTWLCIRLEENQGAGGWEAEFLTKTGVASDLELTPDVLAAQVFAERQAQEVYRSLVKGTA